jgi:hypothetical protein
LKAINGHCGNGHLQDLDYVTLLLRCQAQLKLTLMMCLGDRSTFTSIGTLSDCSTFTSIGTLSGRHDGSSPLFLEDLLSSRCVCVFARVQALSPPPPPHR